jgi:hypothetical protein
MIILIDGLGTSGKAVLRTLFDGHPDLFVCPIHDMIVDAICDYDDDAWLVHKDIVQLRDRLVGTHYYQLEWLAARRHMEIDISVSDRCDFPFRFDFHSFDRLWSQRLMALPHWTAQIIVDELFRAMDETFAACASPAVPRSAAPRGYVAMGFDRPGNPMRFARRYTDAKMIYLARTVEGIIAVRANRRPVDDDPKSFLLRDVTAEKLIATGHARDLIERRAAALAAAEIYPDRIKVVAFEDLVCRTDATIRAIARFLDLPMHDALGTCTVFGQEVIGPSGAKFIGQVLDDPARLLTARQSTMIAIEQRPGLLLTPAGWANPGAALFMIRLWLRRAIDQFRDRLGRGRLERWRREGFY